MEKKRYRVSAEITISVSTIVYTETVEQARAITLEAPMQTFCHQCTRGQEDEWTTTGELDDELDIKHVDEE